MVIEIEIEIFFYNENIKICVYYHIRIGVIFSLFIIVPRSLCLQRFIRIDNILLGLKLQRARKYSL